MQCANSRCTRFVGADQDQRPVTVNSSTYCNLGCQVNAMLPDYLLRTGDRTKGRDHAVREESRRD